METFALYLIKSTVWLTSFFLIYVAFLRNERFFVLNRIFLVSGILVSILFPLFTWHYTVIFPVTPTAEVIEPQVVGITTISEPFPIQNLLLYFYLAGVLYLIFRLIKQTLAVLKIIRISETHHFNSIKLIRTDRYPASFSFFSFVFVNPSIDETETNEIVNHEQEHIRQQHWMDLLLFEILRTMHWFNPVSWLYGQLIRQNHEYLADERALQRSSNPAIYRAALLNQMFGGPVISLANSFNYSLNKKRFNMMKQITYSPFRKLKLLLVLPLIAGVFYAFATPEYKFVQANGTNETSNLPQNLKTVKGRVVKEDGTPLRGTSIVVKQGTNGTLSGENGVFELKVEDNTPLVFSFVGYGSKEVKPDFDQEMTIIMKTQVIGIDAVGNADAKSEKKPSPSLVFIDGKESSMTEMTQIDPAKIEKVDILKGEQAIEKYGKKGKDGVILVTLKKDDPTSQTTKVQSNSPLKFVNADGSGKQPLIIIDGVVAKNQNVNNISPETIESISVLKDESATILYGDSGKNGVVLIKTKKGTSATQNTPVDVKVTGYANDQKKNQNTQPGTGFQIRSAQNESKPLIVVNGVISEDQNIDKIDPETIQSINVIKDETSTKKYGEKGKNGVVEITLKKEKEVFVVVEEMPQFPGGFEALKAFVAATLKYPNIALENGIQGQVTIGFTVAEDGSVTDAKIERSVDPSLDKEALRIVNSMPKWKPGTQRGMPVSVKYEIPINFTYPADYHLKSREKLREKK
jgi:TonB family protein